MARNLVERINIFKEHVKNYSNIINLDKIDSQYKNAKELIRLDCKYHGEFTVVPSNLVSRGDNCPTCKKELNRKYVLNTTSFIKEAKKIHGTIYNYDKTVYKLTRDPVIITCFIHGDFLQKPTHHLCGAGCQLCSTSIRFDKLTKDLEERIIEFNKVHNNFYDYSYITNYENTHSTIKIKCPLHGFFTQIVTNHVKGSRCPSCSSLFSKGSTKIQFYLSSNNIDFILEHTFENLVNDLTGNKLRFDFYLPKYNCAIEFQGQQHYKEISNFFTNDSLKERQHKDNIKVKYCKDNNIKLLIIPYWEEINIEAILKNSL
jgi:hypothetical protein